MFPLKLKKFNFLIKNVVGVITLCFMNIKTLIGGGHHSSFDLSRFITPNAYKIGSKKIESEKFS
jgi:hypothetical protein